MDESNGWKFQQMIKLQIFLWALSIEVSTPASLSCALCRTAAADEASSPQSIRLYICNNYIITLHGIESHHDFFRLSPKEFSQLQFHLITSGPKTSQSQSFESSCCVFSVRTIYQHEFATTYMEPRVSIDGNDEIVASRIR